MLISLGDYPRIAASLSRPRGAGSTLEASFIAFQLPPFHANLGKRLAKRPKIYFHDPGLAVSLLGIDELGQLAAHPLRGAVFEGWVVSEIVKSHRHRGLRPAISFYRERDRDEIDLALERGADLTLVEAKAGRTPTSSHFAAFPALAESIAARRRTPADQTPHGGLRRRGVAGAKRGRARRLARPAGGAVGRGDVARLSQSTSCVNGHELSGVPDNG